MKKYALLAIVVAVCLSASFAIAAQVTLQWDPNNNPAPDDYKLYQRLEGQLYDYTKAVPNPPDHMDGAIPHPQVTFTVTLPDPNPAPPAPSSLQGSFDRTNSQISLQWQQTQASQTDRYFWVVRAEIPPDQSGDSNEVYQDITGKSSVVRWRVFYSLTSGGPWTLLDAVQNTGQATPTTTAAFTAVPAGSRATVFFTLVAFNSDTLFSVNSQELSVDVDRRTLNPPVLTIQTTVPVQ